MDSDLISSFFVLGIVGYAIYPLSPFSFVAAQIIHNEARGYVHIYRLGLRVSNISPTYRKIHATSEQLQQHRLDMQILRV